MKNLNFDPIENEDLFDLSENYEKLYRIQNDQSKRDKFLQVNIVENKIKEKREIKYVDDFISEKQRENYTNEEIDYIEDLIKTVGEEKKTFLRHYPEYLTKNFKDEDLNKQCSKLRKEMHIEKTEENEEENQSDSKKKNFNFYDQLKTQKKNPVLEEKTEEILFDNLPKIDKIDEVLKGVSDFFLEIPYIEDEIIIKFGRIYYLTNKHNYFEETIEDLQKKNQDFNNMLKVFMFNPYNSYRIFNYFVNEMNLLQNEKVNSATWIWEQNNLIVVKNSTKICKLILPLIGSLLDEFLLKKYSLAFFFETNMEILEKKSLNGNFFQVKFVNKNEKNKEILNKEFINNEIIGNEVINKENNNEINKENFCYPNLTSFFECYLNLEKNMEIEKEDINNNIIEEKFEKNILNLSLILKKLSFHKDNFIKNKFETLYYNYLFFIYYPEDYIIEPPKKIKYPLFYNKSFENLIEDRKKAVILTTKIKRNEFYRKNLSKMSPDIFQNRILEICSIYGIKLIKYLENLSVKLTNENEALFSKLKKVKLDDPARIFYLKDLNELIWHTFDNNFYKFFLNFSSNLQAIKKIFLENYINFYCEKIHNKNGKIITEEEKSKNSFKIKTEKFKLEFIEELKLKIENSEITLCFEKLINILNSLLEFFDLSAKKEEKEILAHFYYAVKSFIILHSFLNLPEENYPSSLNGIKINFEKPNINEFFPEKFNIKNNNNINNKPPKQDSNPKLKIIKAKSKIEDIFSKLYNKLSNIIKFYYKNSDFSNKYDHYILNSSSENRISLDTKLDYLGVKSLKRAEEQSISEKKTILMVIDRSRIWLSSFKTLLLFNSSELVVNDFRIEFEGEMGEDEGGLTREWSNLLSKEIFDPMNGLFIFSEHLTSIQPGPLSVLIPDYKIQFRILGRLIGKSLIDENLCLQVYLLF